MTVPIFELRDVTYRYHEVTALDGLNLTIMPGERVALWERTVRESRPCSVFSTVFVFRRREASPSRESP